MTKQINQKGAKAPFKYKEQVGTKWCLTIHGANPDGNCPILGKLREEFQKDEYPLAAVAYETGKYGIHPHWQCYFETAKRRRMKQKFLDLLEGNEGFHLEVAQGTLNANLKYIYAVEKQHQLGWIHYAKGHNVPASYQPYKTQNMLWLRQNMSPWQKELYERVTQKADYRDILWVWEPIGNTGKTYFAKYLHYFHGAIATGGKPSDMKHAIARWQQITGHYPVIMIVDLARSDHISKDSFATLEQIKNAYFFSGKYQSEMVASICPPHIIVFSNTPPDRTAMSSDRWVVKLIDPMTKKLIPG